MKLTFRQLVNSLGNAEMGDPGAFARFRAAQLPLKTAISMKSINRAITQHVDDYNELRLDLCKKFGTLNEEVGVYELGDNQAAFDKEMVELLDSEITINAPRIKTSQLLSSMVISENDLDLLEWLIDDGTTEPEQSAATTA